MVFLDVTIPVFLVAGAGFVFGRMAKLDVSVLGRIVFNVFGPALIFRSLYSADVTGNEVARIAVFVLALHVVLFALSRLMGRLRRWDDDTQAASSLALVLGNYGSYGLPVVYFAFGDRGLVYAVIFFISSVLIQSTLGVGIASWKRGMRPWGVLAGVFRVPWIYAFLLALVLRLADVTLPTGLWRSVELLADGAIPAQLVTLGLELSRLRLRSIAAATVEISLARTIFPPLAALGLAVAVGAEGLLWSVLVLQASMPSAINSMILSIRYDRRPELVASVVFVTTVLSLGSVSLLLHMIR